jgi:hypothetical protein
VDISPDLLEKTCKSTIETILFCLENATKGTVYRIGPMPELLATRVTSGLRDSSTGRIAWGLPAVSDYNPPGKKWEHYRDRPSYILEAMGWCVEQQKSWTADNPHEDVRSVRKQLQGEVEDYHHMEPVLVKKTDLYGDDPSILEYPLDSRGNPIWLDSDFVVVAVIKIHFLPHSFQRGDRSCKLIKQLSRTLGTELLSLHLQANYLQAREELYHQRLESANTLAHELRNTLAKLGFVFSALTAVMSFLREQWEVELYKTFPSMEKKAHILALLNDLILLRQQELNGRSDLVQVCTDLLSEQNELADLFPLPRQGMQWLQRIQSKWSLLLAESRIWEADKDEINRLLARLEKAISVVVDGSLAGRMEHLPKDLREQWPRLAYTKFSADNLLLLDEVVHLLEHPALPVGQKQQIKKALLSLKALVEHISGMENQANRLLYSLKNGEEFKKI